MAKLFALTKIIMPDETVVPRRTVFDATPAQAKQFDKLGSARPATADEIKNAEKLQAEADGLAFLEEVAVGNPGDLADAPEIAATTKKPDSGAPGDPQNTPKGKPA